MQSKGSLFSSRKSDAGLVVHLPTKDFSLSLSSTQTDKPSHPFFSMIAKNSKSIRMILLLLGAAPSALNHAWSETSSPKLSFP